MILKKLALLKLTRSWRIRLILANDLQGWATPQKNGLRSLDTLPRQVTCEANTASLKWYAGIMCAHRNAHSDPKVTQQRSKVTPKWPYFGPEIVLLWPKKNGLKQSKMLKMGKGESSSFLFAHFCIEGPETTTEDPQNDGNQHSKTV